MDRIADAKSQSFNLTISIAVKHNHEAKLPDFVVDLPQERYSIIKAISTLCNNNNVYLDKNIKECNIKLEFTDSLQIVPILENTIVDESSIMGYLRLIAFLVNRVQIESDCKSIPSNILEDDIIKFSISGEMKHKILEYVESIDIGSYHWKSLSEKKDYTCALFERRFWPYIKMSKTSSKNVSLWRYINKKYGRFDYPREITGESSEASEYRLEMKVAKSKKNNNFDAYPLPKRIIDTVPLLRFVAAIEDTKCYDLAVMAFAAVAIHPDRAHVVREFMFWDLAERLFPRSDTEASNMLMYILHFPLYILCHEESIVFSKVSEGSRCIVTADQASRFIRFDKAHIYRNPYIQVATGNQMLELSVPFYDGDSVRAVNNQETFNRYFDWATDGVFEGIDLAAMGAAISGSIVTACRTKITSQWIRCSKLPDSYHIHPLDMKKRNSGLTWEQFINTEEFKNIAPPSTKEYYTLEEINDINEGVRKMMDGSMKGIKDKGPSVVKSKTKAKTTNKKSKVHVEQEDLDGSNSEDDLNSEEEELAKINKKAKMSKQSKHHKKGKQSKKNDSDSDAAVTDDGSESDAEYDKNRVAIPLPKISTMKTGDQPVIDTPEIDDVDSDSDDEDGAMGPGTEYYIDERGNICSYDELVEFYEMTSSKKDKDIPMASRDDDAILTYEEDNAVDVSEKTIFLNVLARYYPGYESYTDAEFAINCKPPNELGAYFKAKSGNGTDIDLSIHCDSTEEFENRARSIYEAIRVNCVRKELGPVWLQTIPTVHTYKFRIYGPGMKRDIDMYHVKGRTPARMVKAYHLDCVHSWFDGNTTRSFVGCVLADLTGMGRTYKWFSCAKDPGAIIMKYVERSYSIPLNINERRVIEEYIRVSTQWKKIFEKYPSMAIWCLAYPGHPILNCAMFNCGIKCGMRQSEPPVSNIQPFAHYNRLIDWNTSYGCSLMRYNDDNTHVKPPQMRIIAQYIKRL